MAVGLLGSTIRESTKLEPNLESTFAPNEGSHFGPLLLLEEKEEMRAGSEICVSPCDSLCGSLCGSVRGVCAGATVYPPRLFLLRSDCLYTGAHPTVRSEKKKKVDVIHPTGIIVDGSVKWFPYDDINYNKMN
jgi:hypothetical protein